MFAEDRLSEIIKNAVVTEFGKRTVAQAISAERAELMRDMRATADRHGAGPRRKRLVDFRVKQVELMDEVKNAVYEQMNEERKRDRAGTARRGTRDAERITGRGGPGSYVILADANRDSQKIFAVRR